MEDGKGQRAESMEHGAWSREHGAESGEQGAWSRERRAESGERRVRPKGGKFNLS